MKRRGHLFILSGPAGAGKGTLRKILFREIPDLVYSVSCTTRPMRPGEAEAKDYYFIDKNRFGQLVMDDAFLEWAEVHGNYYGTRRTDVETCLDLGCDMVLEIDVQGAAQIKEKIPEALRIFITVKSLDELESRLEDRGTESPDQLMVRLKNAATELRYAPEYDYVIVNDDLNRASRELADIVWSYRKTDGEREENGRDLL